MARIVEAKLNISHDHEKRTATPIVTCRIVFTGTELCLMKSCQEDKMFKLRCQLWGHDSGGFGDDFADLFRGGDDMLFTYPTVFYMADTTPSASESRRFEATVGQGLLNEDWPESDEIYGRLILQNLFTVRTVTRKTNVVQHSF